MLKTVVVGSVSVLLGITSQPSAREQVTAAVAVPSQPAAPPSTPTDMQQLPQVREYKFGTFRGFKLDDNGSGGAATFNALQTDTAKTDAVKIEALAGALKTMERQIRPNADCTFSLQMKEVDPNHDPKIHVRASQGGDAKIRRILPPKCLK